MLTSFARHEARMALRELAERACVVRTASPTEH
jgi:hypothetical protein